MKTETAPASSASAWRSGNAPLSVALLLALGSGAAGLVGAALALWLRHAGAATPVLLAASAGVAIVIGVALAAALLARLAQLDRALARLAAGEEVTAPANAWPLDHLLWRIEAVDERIAQGAERERQAAAYRDEVMRQVGEAAAREERNRLARELHDSIKQQLFSIGVSAAAARARAGDSGSAGADATAAALDDIERGAREAQVEMTALLQQLRPAPLENVGLVAALRDQCEALGYRTGAEVSVTIGELPSEDRLPPRAQEQLFRIAQEALANVARHARARHVWLRLEQQGDAMGDAMLLEVRDDGQGFDSAQVGGGMGLGNLRERARALGGAVEMQSAPGRGTTIRVRAPLIAPTRLAPEEVARRAALVLARRLGERWLSWSLGCLQIAAALLILGAPAWTGALALLGAIPLYAVGRWRQGEVARLDGVAGEAALALTQRAREVLAWLLIELAIYVTYAMVAAPRGWPTGFTLGGVIAVAVALLALGVWQWNQWRLATIHYHAALAPRTRQQVIQKRWSETLGLAITLGLVVVIGPFFGGWPVALPPYTPDAWTTTAGLGLLVICCVFAGIELALVWRWRRAATTDTWHAGGEVSGG